MQYSLALRLWSSTRVSISVDKHKLLRDDDEDCTQKQRCIECQASPYKVAENTPDECTEEQPNSRGKGNGQQARDALAGKFTSNGLLRDGLIDDEHGVNSVAEAVQEEELKMVLGEADLVDCSVDKNHLRIILSTFTWTAKSKATDLASQHSISANLLIEILFRLCSASDNRVGAILIQVFLVLSERHASR